jgi:hypothetical protein
MRDVGLEFQADRKMSNDCRRNLIRRQETHTTEREKKIYNYNSSIDNSIYSAINSYSICSDNRKDRW